MKSRFKTITIILFFTILSVLPGISHAQIPSSIDGVRISIDPEIPAPGQTVTVSVESFSTDLNSASIVWIVDGKNYASGTGRKSIGITSPPIGKNLGILAVIMTVEGREVRKGITVKSGGVELVWESGGFVPPFYKGKALFAYENPVRIIAIPHIAGQSGEELDPNTLVYKWTENDKVIQDQSGYGKQTLLVEESIPRPIDIQVEVTTRTGTEKATTFMTLNPGNPSVSFYEEDPLYGVFYNKAITDKIRLTNQEISIRAVPYTFSVSALNYLWSINNLERTDLSTNESITLRTKGDTEGSSNISLEIRSPQNILQGAKKTISVEFSKKPVDNSTTF